MHGGIMKKILLLLVSVGFCFGQTPEDTTIGQYPIDSTTGEVNYSNVAKIEGMSKADIYTKTKNWITASLKSADNMIQLDDTDMNQITSTGTIILDDIRLPYKQKMYCKAYLNFKFIVKIKEGRIKYTVSNFIITYSPIYKNIPERYI